MNALMNSLNMNASMNSLSELNMNASMIFDQMMILSSRARRQILQTLHLNDQWIAQILKSQLDQLEKLLKKQKTELHEH
jgi:hypothetical protein